MNYREFDSDKAFIVMQKSGFGVMEDPYRDVGVVFETNNEQEARDKSKELLEANNTPEQIKSSWIPNTYWVMGNYNSEPGKKYREEQQKLYKPIPISEYSNEIKGFSSSKVTGKVMRDITWRK
jgi:hypothetical protein